MTFFSFFFCSKQRLRVLIRTLFYSIKVVLLGTNACQTDDILVLCEILLKPIKYIFTAKHCPEIYIPNGVVSTCNMTVDSSCSYSCKTGYNQTTPHVTCMPSQTWNPLPHTLCISKFRSFMMCFKRLIYVRYDYMSLVMRKPAFCICENKDADQLRSMRS